MTNSIPQLSTVKQFCKKYPAFTEGGIRDRIFHAASNGLKKHGALLRNGHRVRIDEERFFNWLREHGV